MGAFVGLLLGIGLLLVWQGATSRPKPPRAHVRLDRMREELAQAGLHGITPNQLIALQVLSAFLVALLGLVLTRSVSVSVIFAIFASAIPRLLVTRLRHRRQADLRELWPEVVDNLTSGVRAGLSLPEALSAIGVRGPEQLREPFKQFGTDYRTTGKFNDSLDRLKVALADPVGDRVCESMRVAREVGGTDLGRLLTTLSSFLRDDARTRAELMARQSWSVNAAQRKVRTLTSWQMKVGSRVRVAVYARISADRGGEEAGVSRQLADCSDLIASRGWIEIARFVDNDVSAFSGAKRPGFSQLLARVTAGDVDVIVAYHVDRLYRRVRDLVPLLDACEKRGTTVATVKAGELDLTTAAGRMIASILGSVAEGESARQAERIRRQKLDRALSGKPNGSMRSFGYAQNGDIVESEAVVIRDVANRVLTGQSMRSIVNELNDLGVPTVKGGAWRGPTLRSILMAARLSGQREHTPASQGRGYSNGPIVADGTWEPILTKQDTARLRELLGDPKRRTMRPGQQLLTGLLICGSCGKSMNSHSDSKGGRRYVCIRVPGTGKCGKRSVSGDRSDVYVTEVVFAAIYFDGSPHRFYQSQPDAIPPSAKSHAADLSDQLRTLAAEFANGQLDEDMYEAKAATLKDRRRAILQTAASLSPTTRLALLPATVEGLRGLWPHWQVDQRRAILSAALNSVTLHPSKPGGGPRFDPDRYTFNWRDGLPQQTSTLLQP